MVSDDKDVHTMCDFNIDLLKCESSQNKPGYFNLSSKTMFMSANLQFHPSFFNLFYPKNYRQKYYLYRIMINLMVYAPLNQTTQMFKCRHNSCPYIKLRTYPSKLKITKMTPVFKSDDDTDAKSYRPISLLSNYYLRK